MAEAPLTPQQQKFLSYYLDPESETFSNALQSALRAGYSQEYAESITAQMPDWLSESLGDSVLVKKAEDNLKTFLDHDDQKLKWEATKFTLPRLSKKKYSERTEHTGANGAELTIRFDPSFDASPSSTAGGSPQ